MQLERQHAEVVALAGPGLTGEPQLEVEGSGARDLEGRDRGHLVDLDGFPETRRALDHAVQLRGSGVGCTSVAGHSSPREHLAGEGAVEEATDAPGVPLPVDATRVEQARIRIAVRRRQDHELRDLHLLPERANRLRRHGDPAAHVVFDDLPQSQPLLQGEDDHARRGGLGAHHRPETVVHGRDAPAAHFAARTDFEHSRRNREHAAQLSNRDEPLRLAGGGHRGSVVETRLDADDAADEEQRQIRSGSIEPHPFSEERGLSMCFPILSLF